MTAQQALDHLERALMKDEQGRFFFCCKTAIVIIKLHGITSPLRFPACDKIGFRIDGAALTIECLASGAVKKLVRWEEIETLAVGEPEMAHGNLFQG